MSDSPIQDEGHLSTAEKLIAARAQRALDKEKFLENAKEYAKALNGQAATPNGLLVLRTWVKALGVFKSKSGLEGIPLVKAQANSDFYLEFIRPFLEPEIRQKVEE